MSFSKTTSNLKKKGNKPSTVSGLPTSSGVAGVLEKLKSAERKRRLSKDIVKQEDTKNVVTINPAPIPASTDTQSVGCDEELAERAAVLCDPQLLWSHYFSGLIDDAASYTVEENLEGSFVLIEKESKGVVSHFPIKLILTHLKRAHGVDISFASLLLMEFGPLHVALRIGDIILEWDDSSLVVPHRSKCQDHVIETEVQCHGRWMRCTRQHQPKTKEEVPEQINLIYVLPSKKKTSIDDLIDVIIRYNKYFKYNLLKRNSQHFVSDALRALKVDFPDEFTRGLGGYYDSLIEGKTPSVPSHFNNHSLLTQYVEQMQRDDTLASMPQHDLEYLLALYFHFHLESKIRLVKEQRMHGAEQHDVEWQCQEENCLMATIQQFVQLESLKIHGFKTVS